MVHLCGISRPERDTSVRLGKKKAAARSSGDQFEEGSVERVQEGMRGWAEGSLGEGDGWGSVYLWLLRLVQSQHSATNMLI